jgi:hypothetical protein
MEFGKILAFLIAERKVVTVTDRFDVLRVKLLLAN